MFPKGDRRIADDRQFASLVCGALADLQADFLCDRLASRGCGCNHRAISAVGEEEEERERVRHMAAKVPTSYYPGIERCDYTYLGRVATTPSVHPRFAAARPRVHEKQSPAYRNGALQLKAIRCPWGRFRQPP